MYAERDEKTESARTDAQRIYALLYKLQQDVRRLEALVRAVKKQTEEQNNE